MNVDKCNNMMENTTIYNENSIIIKKHNKNNQIKVYKCDVKYNTCVGKRYIFESRHNHDGSSRDQKDRIGTF